MTKQDILKGCTVYGNVVKLPDGQLDRKLYQEVSKALELIGGKWKGGKIMGFIFQSDPTELLQTLQNGETIKKVDLKKEYQFFATPALLADVLVKKAEIRNFHDILEPSAGQGAIINAIHRVLPNKLVFCCELMELNRQILHQMGLNVDCMAADFLTLTPPFKFDRIISNPPFQKNFDIDHIYKMYDCLKYEGRIVTISSKHWDISSNKKETDFKNWLNKVGAEIEEIPSGSFKESGTNVGGFIIVINK